jgi:hypothetical protein
MRVLPVSFESRGDAFSRVTIVTGVFRARTVGARDGVLTVFIFFSFSFLKEVLPSSSSFVSGTHFFFP